MGRMSSRKDNYAWTQWYPEDWLTDAALVMCSLAAQGLWMRLLCHAWKAPVRGVLPGDARKLARLAGASVDEVAILIGELEDEGVFSRGEDIHADLEADAIVNRRMYREWRLVRTRSEAGRAGGRPRKPAVCEGGSRTPGDDAPEKANGKQTLSKSLAKRKQNESKITAPKPPTVNDLRRNLENKTKANGKQTPKQLSGKKPEARSQRPETRDQKPDLLPRDLSSGIEVTTPNSETEEKIYYPRVGDPNPAREAEPEAVGVSVSAFFNSIPEAGRAGLSGPSGPPGPPKEHPVPELVRRIKALTEDGPEWQKWFRESVQTLYQAPGGHTEMAHLVSRVESSQDPVQRRAKDIGEIHSPGKFLSAKFVAWARAHRVKLPQMPKSAA